MTGRLLIANRGEIARRVLRAGRERGLAVAVISTPEDADACIRKEADAVLEVSSFLAGAEIVAAAVAWGVFGKEALMAVAPDFWAEAPHELLELCLRGGVGPG